MCSLSRSGILSLNRLSRILAAGLVAALALTPFSAAAQDGTPAPAPTTIPAERVPFFHDWFLSPHAKADARAFTNWNDKGEIPEACARCHSTPGFLDYIGADGSAVGSVEKKAPTGSVIGCMACHNETTRAMTGVTFPSGHRVEDLGPEVRCMTCHQGRESTLSVNRAVAGIEDDTVSPDLTFLNVHYRAAGATLMGTLAKGGYEYEGQSYASQRRHAAPFNTCISCHELHTVQPKVEPCAACHTGLTDRKSLSTIRKSAADHDGDGDVTEGIAAEITALHERLLEAIKTYGKDVAGSAIAYDGHAHPYFFNDLDASGSVEESEAVAPNKYASWTPRLLRAAYNYQFVAKDPGAYAHNAPYVLQLLHDSLADLDKGAVAGLVRP